MEYLLSIPLLLLVGIIMRKEILKSKENVIKKCELNNLRNKQTNEINTNSSELIYHNDDDINNFLKTSNLAKLNKEAAKLKNDEKRLLKIIETGGVGSDLILNAEKKYYKALDSNIALRNEKRKRQSERKKLISNKQRKKEKKEYGDFKKKWNF